jgi:acetylornithine deacetylase/succinyl-diaminopimelate desuccinylase-like protein
MPDLEQAITYAYQHRQDFLNDLKMLIAIPSISTLPENQPDMQRAAEFIAGLLSSMGLDAVTVYQTARHPVVYGEWKKAGDSAPTVLIYGHYDVQPVDPIALWETPPFEPVQHGEYLNGRGSSDMKGQTMAAIKAVKAVLHSGGTLPVNVKFLIEGEEEIGSPSLASFMEAHRQMLACNFALNPDAGMIAADIPTIVYGLRGMSYFELRVYGPVHDLHSGVFGGVIHNPAQALCELIAGMHDDQGRITLPGFYEKVVPLSHEEHQQMINLPMNDDYYLQQTGAPALWGEEGYSPAERVGARPTLDVCGFLSGFTGQGGKTVIPASAMAKLSMRLVPNQDPHEVGEQLRQYLKTKAPSSIRWELDQMSGGPACQTNPDSLGSQALAKALQSVWGKTPVFKREGGSIPVVSAMQRILGVDSVLTGFGLPGDNIHAPNEHLHLNTWYRGIDALIHFLFNLK